MTIPADAIERVDEVLERHGLIVEVQCEDDDLYDSDTIPEDGVMSVVLFEADGCTPRFAGSYEAREVPGVFDFLGVLLDGGLL